MSTATISSGGNLAIPPEFRRAMHLAEGAQVILSMEDGKLIIQPAPVSGASLTKGEFGRPVLQAPPNSPAMTPEQVKAILDES